MRALAHVLLTVLNISCFLEETACFFSRQLYFEKNVLCQCITFYVKAVKNLDRVKVYESCKKNSILLRG